MKREKDKGRVKYMSGHWEHSVGETNESKKKVLVDLGYFIRAIVFHIVVIEFNQTNMDKLSLCVL